MNQLNNAFTLFLSLMVEAMPFLLLGVAFSSILLLFVDERKLIAAMPRNPLLGALAGSLVGFLFPVCECGNVPVARRLLMKGAPASVAVGFLLAAPTINPVVIWATWTAFRDQPEIVVLRIVFSLSIATLIGWTFSSQKDIRPLLQPNISRLMPAPSTGNPAKDNPSNPGTSVSPLLQSGTYLLQQPGQMFQLDNSTAYDLFASSPVSKPLAAKLKLMLDNMVQELRELGGILVLGAAIAAFVQVAVPREIILSLGQGPITSILAMMILAMVVSICSTVDSFFALSFASTFTSGSLLSFLVFGPMIDLKNIGLLMTVFRPRVIVYLFALAGQMTFVFALLVNLHVG
ncbi:MAG: permease [Leptolyngbyaceae cyanobacterium MO_188.B28]|nr:permease [Leptolyngbyaceae cyanobacterium MO_188.B28]